MVLKEKIAQAEVALESLSSYCFFSWFFQPPSYLVEYPSLLRRSCWRALALVVVVFFALLAPVLLITRRSTYLPVQKNLAKCKFPEPSDGESCREITRYPLRITVPLHNYIMVDVDLLGPSHVTSDNLEKAILGMSCNISSPTGAVSYLEEVGGAAVQAAPSDFRRVCKNPDVPGITFSSTFDKELQISRICRGLQQYMSLHSDALLTLPKFVLDRCVLAKLEVGQRWYGHFHVFLVFDDSRTYGFAQNILCDTPNVTVRRSWMTRWENRSLCGPGNRYDENLHTCEYYSSRNFTAPWRMKLVLQTVLAATTDPLMRRWSGIRTAEAVEEAERYGGALRRKLNVLCTGFNVSIYRMITELEFENYPVRRNFTDVVSYIVDEVEKRCPYEFICERHEFGGYPLWFVLIIPWIGIVIQATRLTAPFSYFLFVKSEVPNNKVSPTPVAWEDMREAARPPGTPQKLDVKALPAD